MSTSEDYNPIEHFQQWYYEVEKAHPEDETNVMLLSTVGLDGFPKSRIVLLKRFTWEGFYFFTNYHSEKGKAIATNNKVSISFLWKKSKREVFISGKAEKIAENLSEGYFESRPLGSQLGAWASKQSEVVSSRKVLDNSLKHYENKYKNTPVPKPENWGGYLIKPEEIEFADHNPDNTASIQYKLQKDYSWSREVKPFIPLR